MCFLRDLTQTARIVVPCQSSYKKCNEKDTMSVFITDLVHVAFKIQLAVASFSAVTSLGSLRGPTTTKTFRVYSLLKCSV